MGHERDVSDVLFGGVLKVRQTGAQLVHATRIDTDTSASRVRRLLTSKVVTVCGMRLEGTPDRPILVFHRPVPVSCRRCCLMAALGDGPDPAEGSDDIGRIFAEISRIWNDQLLPSLRSFIDEFWEFFAQNKFASATVPDWWLLGPEGWQIAGDNARIMLSSAGFDQTHPAMLSARPNGLDHTMLMLMWCAPLTRTSLEP